jgi:hypothetical protein
MVAAVESRMASGGARVRVRERWRAMKRKKGNKTADGSVKKNSDLLFKG